MNAWEPWEELITQSSAADKAVYCVCTPKFSASTLENLSWVCTKKNLQNQQYASLRQSHVYPDNFVYGIYLPHHRSVLRNADQFCNAE